MTNSYFRVDGPNLVPAPEARGPWAEDMMHGRLLGGLAARSIEQQYHDEGWRVSRLTVDLFRPAAMEAVQIATTPVRQGRRVQVIDALLMCGGHTVGRATAVLLTTGEEPPGSIWRPEPSPWPDPASLPEPSPNEPSQDGWKIRWVQGGFGTGERSRVWTNDTVELVHGEAMSPLVRAAVSGDLACPIANSSDQGLHYINADYTLLLARYPVGDWIGVEVAQQLHSDGVSIASATLVDAQGPFATSSGSSLVRPALHLSQ